jgi:hypothetical protein
MQLEGEKQRAQPKEYIGTGEELEPILKQMPKQQFRLTLLEGQESEDRSSAERPFYKTATPEEWAKAFREWAASHDPTTPPLSDEAISRDSIYEGRG